MFDKLRRKIILIIMASTTAVLLLASFSIMFFSSALRPDPRPDRLTIEVAEPESTFPSNYSEQELAVRIKDDRREGDIRLLLTLICVDIAIELAVFVIASYLSDKIVAPAAEAYDKQKLFIANASHELKTPLAVIQANLEALDISQSDQKWQQNIEAEITRANKLVLDLLQLAKMDAGSLSKTPATQLDLSTEIKQRIDTFQPQFSHPITFTSTAKSTHTLPRPDILQVVDILLDNAIKYGHRKIAVKLTPNQIAISNDGTTIPKPDLDKIFDRFYQTDKTKSGSGLGLAIAKAVCEQNHWQISCASTAKQTTFTITLPPGA